MALVLVVQAAGLAIDAVTAPVGVPARLGNHPATLAALEREGSGREAFSFAVLGDPESSATGARLFARLAGEGPDFGVLVGDGVRSPTYGLHEELRRDLAGAGTGTFPWLFIPGNRDVDPRRFPVARFEAEYGAADFAFVYGGCLFAGLRFLPAPDPTGAGLDRLEAALARTAGAVRHRFVFVHVPPPVFDGFSTRPVEGAERLLALCARYRVDYLFAADLHGHARTERDGTAFVVTGGGGGSLHRTGAGAFFHGLVIRVGPRGIDEELVVVEAATDLRKALRVAVLGQAIPWIRLNPRGALLADVLLLVVAWALARGPWSRGGR